MFKFPSIQAVYTRLYESEANDDDHVSDKGALLPKHSDPLIFQQGRTWASSTAVHIAIIGSEIILLVVLIAGYMVLNNKRHGSLSGEDSIDGLSRLATTYNTTMTFHNQSDLLRSSQEADTYWARLLESGGVVSLDTEWARGQGLRKSATSPTDPSQSIYQVDIFHALHCMVRSQAPDSESTLANV
jgi:hypothetical protein